jgi:hypothetical protein
VWSPGQVVNVSEDLADDLVAGKYAVYAEPRHKVKLEVLRQRPIETATIEPPEQAVTRKRRPRRRAKP